MSPGGARGRLVNTILTEGGQIMPINYIINDCKVAQWEIYMGQPQNKYVTLFHLFFQVMCIYYQPNLWLSGLEHLASIWEVSRLSTRLNFDLFFLSNFSNSHIWALFALRFWVGHVTSKLFYLVLSLCK